MNVQSASRRAASPGDTYLAPLSHGGFGAVRVLRVDNQTTEPGSLVAVTTWRGYSDPGLGDPALRTILRQYRGRYSGELAICWFDGYPDESLRLVGNIPPTDDELAIDPHGAYCGWWRIAMAQDLDFELAWNSGTPVKAARTARAGDEPSNERADVVSGRLGLEDFWILISRINWSAPEESAVVEPLVDDLSRLPVEKIAGFQRVLTERLFELDTARHAREIGAGSYGSDEGFSVDHFLDVRCAVVANGESYFRSVLADPQRMPKDVTFEPLLALAESAYRRKTGRSVEFEGVAPVETFCNREGWRAERAGAR